MGPTCDQPSALGNDLQAWCDGSVGDAVAVSQKDLMQKLGFRFLIHDRQVAFPYLLVIFQSVENWALSVAE